MTSAILLRSGVNRKVHAPFWSRVGRGNPPGLGNNQTSKIVKIERKTANRIMQLL
jgi:hypothetical protein